MFSSEYNFPLPLFDKNGSPVVYDEQAFLNLYDQEPSSSRQMTKEEQQQPSKVPISQDGGAKKLSNFDSTLQNGWHDHQQSCPQLFVPSLDLFGSFNELPLFTQSLAQVSLPSFWSSESDSSSSNKKPRRGRTDIAVKGILRHFWNFYTNILKDRTNYIKRKQNKGH